MRRPRVAVLALLTLGAVVAAAGCATLGGSESASGAREAITRANRAFEDGVRRGDAERLGSMYTADAIAFPPDAPMVRGRQNIAKMWGSVISDLGLKAVELRTVDIEVAGDTAYETGEATLRLEPRGGQVSTAAIKYVVVWKKVDGQWRLHRDIWNPIPK